MSHNASEEDPLGLITHEGHESFVYSVAFSPDGKSVASGSEDKTIRIWSAYEPTPIGNPFKGHTAGVCSVVYSPLGDMIASGSLDHTIRLWDINTKQQIDEPLKAHSGCVNSIAFSPGGKFIASGSVDKSIRLWNIDTRLTSNTFWGHNKGIRSVDFSPNDNQFASGSGDFTIRVWDTESGKPVGKPFMGHHDVVHSVSYAPNANQIASGSSDGTLQLWDVRSGMSAVNLCRGKNESIFSVSYSPSGVWIASGSIRGTVCVWDIRNRGLVADKFNKHTDWVRTVKFSPWGNRIVSGSGDQKVMAWNVVESLRSSVGLIGRDTSIHLIFATLLEHGCANLTSQIDLERGFTLVPVGGGFGDIRVGRLRDKTRVALKTLRTPPSGQSSDKLLKHAAQEIHLWSKMKHENIHRLLGVIIFEGHYLGMISEWMDNGNLYNYMLKHPEFDRCKMWHGDLKAVGRIKAKMNVLVSSEGIPKLTDFGISTISTASIAFSTTTSALSFSYRWAAPELLQESPKSEKSDIYALGMTMLVRYTMLFISGGLS
ncbi:protein kinase, partial [Rhizoctonia solani]